MVSHRGLPRAVAVLAALLMLLTAVSQAIAAPGSGGEQVAATGQAHHLEGDFDAETRDRVQGYEIANPDRDLNLVIGNDDRVQVTQTDQYPNSAIAYIEAYNEAEEMAFRCTATFVAPNVLLTAAHCVYVAELGGWPDGVLVVPGISGESEPFGYEFAADLWVPDGWLEADGDINAAYPHDYALITLPDNTLGDQVGTWEIGVLSTETLQAADFNPTTTGYPADKEEITQWFGTQPSFVSVDDVNLAHDIDAFQGQSGSAIWRGSDRAVVGVMSYETQEHNYARRIDQVALDGLLAGCESLGCSFNYFIEGEEPPPDDGTPPPPDDGTPPPPDDDNPPPPDDDVPPPPADDASAFQGTWDRTDKPVQDGQVDRTWMWGPPFTEIITEPYADSPEGERAVKYHEKSRMEITDPAGDASSTWYVTNGLIAKELVTGNLQLGDDTFEQHQPAEVNAAGDLGDLNAPTYATFGNVLDAPPQEVGTPITSIINRAGEVDDDQGDDQALGTGGEAVTAAYLVPETNHTVASPFWNFMNSTGLVYEDGQLVEGQLFENPFFATGFPITEAYWATVQLNGEPTQVLIQVFERRVLTYTPDNPEGWTVEAANVGTHYHQWRYELVPGEDGETPPPDDEPTPPDDGDDDGDDTGNVPAEGEVFFTSDLTDVQPLEEEGATGAPSENGYTITTAPGAELGVVRLDEFGDGSYSVDFRVTAPATTGAACVVVGETAEGTSHQVCAAYNTETAETGTISSIAATYGGEAAGEWEISPVDASGWHELKVVTSGGTFWVLFDGAVAGTYSHEATSTGNFGFSALNLEDAEAEAGTESQIEFTELTVKALQQ